MQTRRGQGGALHRRRNQRFHRVGIPAGAIERHPGPGRWLPGTLYRAFGDKEGLAHAIIQRRLHDLELHPHDLGLEGLRPEQALGLAAVRIADGLAAPESVGVHRIAIGEGQSFPALRDWFFDHAVAALRNTLRDYFAKEVAAGRLVMPSPALASTHFFMMLFGDLVLRTSSGNLQAVDAAALRLHVLESIDIFLHGTLPR